MVSRVCHVVSFTMLPPLIVTEPLAPSWRAFGTGPVVETLSNVDLKYVGAIYGTAKEFDSSWSRGNDETFAVQACAVGGAIVGFSVGPIGMRQGGRRVITIPAELGYGAQGSPPTIPANATLVFVVDAVRVT